MTFQSELPAVFDLISGAAAIALCGFALRKREFHPASAWMLILYGSCLAGVSGLLFGAQKGLLNGLRVEFTGSLGDCGALLLAWVLLGYVHVYLRSNRGSLIMWAALLVPISALILLDSKVIDLPDNLFSGRLAGFYQPATTWALLAGWAVLVFWAFVVTLRRLRHTSQPLHRNRIQHLLLIYGLFILSGAAGFCGMAAAGTGLQVLCGAFMAAAALTHRLPDLRKLFRAALSGLLTALACAALFAGGFFTLQAAFGSLDIYRPAWNGIILAACLAAVYHPLFAAVQKLVQALLPETNYQAARIVHEYSAAISNIVDMELLAAAAVGSIREILGISRGHLLLVEKQENSRESGYRLRDVTIEGETALNPGLIAFTSPIAAHFVHEQRPLTQYELDLAAEFQQGAGGERAWFSATGLEVYLPVLVQDEWIGLLAFGPKAGRARYGENDLMLLSALACQTAVSLQNARLVQHLTELNEQLTRAYAALNTANQQLERLDRTKTDFINIASHELRTPLTLLLGYAEMLADDENLLHDPFYSQMIAGIQNGTHRLHEIVGSMLDMAKIDSRALDLAPKTLSLPTLIRNIYGGLSKAMLERDLHFEMVELTSLPLIEADPEALQKVFYHLMVNAVKFTPDGGQIKVMQRLAPASTSLLGKDSVEVIISDTGIGIDPDMQELIFIKFYHSGPVDLHSSGKTKFKGGGPGLGLAIVRGIVDAHNGRVWVESTGCDEQACPGSQFHVLLPLSQKAYREPATVPVERRQEVQIG